MMKITIISIMLFILSASCAVIGNTPKWEHLRTWTESRIEGDTLYSFKLNSFIQESNRLAIKILKRVSGIKFTQERQEYRLVYKDGTTKTTIRYANLNCSKKRPCYTWYDAWPTLPSDGGGLWENKGNFEENWTIASEINFVIQFSNKSTKKIITDNNGILRINTKSNGVDISSLQILNKDGKVLAEAYKDNGSWVVEKIL